MPGNQLLEIIPAVVGEIPGLCARDAPHRVGAGNETIRIIEHQRTPFRQQAAIVASKESRGIEFKFGDGSVVLNLTTAEVGQSRIELPVAFDGSEITITLDHQFLGDFLRVLDPDKTFTLDVENAEQAALCLTDDGYGYVVMPLAPDRPTSAKK